MKNFRVLALKMTELCLFEFHQFGNIGGGGVVVVVVVVVGI